MLYSNNRLHLSTPRYCQALLLALALLAPLAGQAGDFGRLFTTPEQRQALETLRTTGYVAPVSDASEFVASQTPGERKVLFNGIYKSSSGNTLYFINQSLPGEPVSIVRRNADQSVQVQVAKSGQAATLKPGQSLLLNSGELRDVYQRVAPKQPAPATTGSVAESPAEIDAES